MGTDPRVSVALMAHPRRAKFVTQLRRKLDCASVVAWDRRNNRWDTGRRALLSYDPQATHHCVIQDDAVVPHHLMRGVAQALSQVPVAAGTPTPLCLYTGRTERFRPQLDRLTKRDPVPGWLRMSSVYWGVGLVFPTELIKPMVAWADRQKHIANYDLRIGAWMADQGIAVWYPFPSLVDHRSSPSLVPGRISRSRRAYRFVGKDASLLDYKFGRDFVDVAPSAL